MGPSSSSCPKVPAVRIVVAPPSAFSALNWVIWTLDESINPRSATWPNSSSCPSKAPEKRLEPIALAKRRLFGASYSMSCANGPRSNDPDMVDAAKDQVPCSTFTWNFRLR